MARASGTYGWQPALSDLIIAAYARCQIRRQQITVEHLQDAATACNLLQLEWANEQVNLWTVELATTLLVAGQATYPVNPNTVMIMAAYITTGEVAVTVDALIPSVDSMMPTVDTVSFPAQVDRIITSLDRDTYASFPRKQDRGPPTVFWFDQQINPTITLWQVPDTSQRYVLHYYRAREMQDAILGDGVLAEVPKHFLEAYVAALAFKLAEMYAPGRMDELLARAKVTFDSAAQRDVEDAPLRIVPALSAYTNSVY